MGKPLDGSVFRFLPLCWSYAPEKTLPASFLQGVGLAGALQAGGEEGCIQEVTAGESSVSGSFLCPRPAWCPLGFYLFWRTNI